MCIALLSGHATDQLHEENTVIEKDPDLALLHGKPRDGLPGLQKIALDPKDIHLDSLPGLVMEAGENVERRRKNGQVALFADLISGYISGLETQFANVL